MKQEKRHKLQLHYEILCALDDSVFTYQIVRLTNIQHICRLSYVKLINHLIDIEQKGMIHRDMENNGSITLTKKGKMFLRQYETSKSYRQYGVIRLDQYRELILPPKLPTRAARLRDAPNETPVEGIFTGVGGSPPLPLGFAFV